MKRTSLLSVLFMLSTIACFSQIPTLTEKNGRHALLVDGKPFFILGGQAHNSSAWPQMLPQLWQAIEVMHANTLEVPVYWEQLEPQEGKFDFSVVDLLLSQARAHHTRLVLLWFGTWKNGSSHYMPAWMKRQPEKYPNISGKNGKLIDSPSPFAKATLDADVNAFSLFMRHLKIADSQHTVIMVQVENESGSWDSMRDYSTDAQKLFDAQVPDKMLNPELLGTLHVPAGSYGTWREVFGERADEYFSAWYIASFIGKVAAAGKAQYPLPMYVNAALRDPLTNPMANEYESGGPTDNVILIWKLAAPALDIVAPDIYIPGSEPILKVLELYSRADNALFVPEAALNSDRAKYLYDVFAKGGIGFSPFGIDANIQAEPVAETAKRLAPFAQDYGVMLPMISELAKWGFEGKIKAVVGREDHAAQMVNLGAWAATVSFKSIINNEPGGKDDAPGKILIIQLNTSKFILVGAQCHITFAPTGANISKAWQYLKVEEGQYQNGIFKPMRILNGDETDFGGPRFGSLPTVLRVEIIAR